MDRADCPVCWATTPLVTLPCTHAVCNYCLRQLLAQMEQQDATLRCPMCRDSSPRLLLTVLDLVPRTRQRAQRLELLARQAAASGEADLLQCNLEAGAGCGDLLAATAQRGHAAAAQVLLDHGAEVDVRDERGYTALRVAVNFAQAEVVQVLLDAKAAPDVRSLLGGRTPLITASGLHDGEPIVAMLLAARADPTLACRVDFSSEPDFDAEDTIFPCDGWTALHSAVQGGTPEMCRILIEHGADCMALCALQAEIVELFGPQFLLSGKTPLHVACRLGRAACAKVLLEATTSELQKRQVASRDGLGLTPLHCAARACDKASLELLLAKKADPHAKVGPSAFFAPDPRCAPGFLKRARAVGQALSGLTPLHLVACGGAADPMMLLVHGQDLARRQKEAAELLVQVQQVDARRQPLVLGLPHFPPPAAGDFPSALRTVGQGWLTGTPLHAAAHFGQTAVIQVLLKAQADPLLRSDGLRPLDMAKHAARALLAKPTQQAEDAAEKQRWAARRAHDAAAKRAAAQAKARAQLAKAKRKAKLAKAKPKPAQAKAKAARTKPLPAARKPVARKPAKAAPKAPAKAPPRARPKAGPHAQKAGLKAVKPRICKAHKVSGKPLKNGRKTAAKGPKGLAKANGAKRRAPAAQARKQARAGAPSSQ